MNKEKIKKSVLCAIFAAIISAIAPFTIPIGPIPFSLAVFAVFLSAAILPPSYSVTATLIYIALGAVGIPVFSGFRSGIATLVGPTGGYLITYPLMALVIGMSIKTFKKRSFASLMLGMTVALLLCYTGGTVWFCYVTKKTVLQALSVCIYPFVPFDIVKMIAATLAALGLEKTISYKKWYCNL